MTLKNTLLSAVMWCAMSGTGLSYAASAPDGTDIYMASLSKSSSGGYQAGKFEQVTTRKGYDNQPYFLPNGKGLLYTAMLVNKDGSYQSDSFEYQFATKKHVNLTNTPTSEYSPLVTPDGQYFSTIVVRDNEQQLWAQPYGNQAKAYRINNSEPVGYHAWGVEGELVMFVLGEPHTLQYQPSSQVAAKVVAKNIGRSLRYVSARRAFSFSYQKADGTWYLAEYLPQSDKVVDLTPLLVGSGYFTWLDDNTVISSTGGQIHQWHYQHKGKSTVKHWQLWLDVSDSCATQVSRLAVDADGSRIAFVCDER